MSKILVSKLYPLTVSLKSSYTDRDVKRLVRDGFTPIMITPGSLEQSRELDSYIAVRLGEERRTMGKHVFRARRYHRMYVVGMPYVVWMKNVKEEVMRFKMMLNSPIEISREVLSSDN